MGENPLQVDKPWGQESWWADTGLYAGKVLHIEAGRQTGLQRHHEREEAAYLIFGRLRLLRGVGDGLEEQLIEPGDAWRLKPGTAHSVEAIEDSLVLEVSSADMDALVRVWSPTSRL